MQRRFVTIWFRFLKTDWHCRRRKELGNIPFILATPDHGRMVVTETNAIAQTQGAYIGMAVADARAIIPSLEVIEDKSGHSEALLNGIAEWCIRYTPCISIDNTDGLILDVTGCAHLWGGEKQYLTAILKRLKEFGYNARASMADTIGAAWAATHFGKNNLIIESGNQSTQLLSFPPASLRIEPDTAERLEKLGLRQIKNFITIPRPALSRRFGKSFLLRLDQALGHEAEMLQPIHPIEPYQERLPCLEPIVTAKGIEIALENLLNTLCSRLQKGGKGLRAASFMGYRLDGKTETIDITTTRATCNRKHLFKLFEIRINTIEPALGIELFILNASGIENVIPHQHQLWIHGGLNDVAISELLDRIGGKVGASQIQRYVPDEHHWPERSFRPAASINEKLTSGWKVDRPRPLQLLSNPETIEVTAPIPDYPPMLFRYKGKLHKIMKADGPERIEEEWWLQEGQHRDYYSVEDEEGNRYWIFRLGHYDADKTYRWFLHGFFA
jgi:protein ImuB